MYAHNVKVPYSRVIRRISLISASSLIGAGQLADINTLSWAHLAYKRMNELTAAARTRLTLSHALHAARSISSCQADPEPPSANLSLFWPIASLLY